MASLADELVSWCCSKCGNHVIRKAWPNGEVELVLGICHRCSEVILVPFDLLRESLKQRIRERRSRGLDKPK